MLMFHPGIHKYVFLSSIRFCCVSLLFTDGIGNEHRTIRPRGGTWYTQDHTMQTRFQRLLGECLLLLLCLPSLSIHCCFHSISSFTTTAHTHIRMPSFRSHTKVFQRHVEHKHKQVQAQVSAYSIRSSIRQRLCVGASAASSTFHAWVGEAKHIHAEEMKFSHRWTSEVKPCIDLCAATAATIIITITISKTKWFFLFWLFIRCAVCAQKLNLLIVRVFNSVYFSVMFGWYAESFWTEYIHNTVWTIHDSVHTSI